MVRTGQMEVRIIVGVGETHGRIPLRVLGYAKMLADVINHDIGTFLKKPRIHLHTFCSGTKLAALSADSDIQAAAHRGIPALVALAEGLRIVGFEHPISIDLAAPVCEVSDFVYDQLI